VITIAMARSIRATRAHVWTALADPAAVAHWDAALGNGGALDVPADYPQPGQHVRWRYRLGGVPLLLQEQPLEVVPEERLRSRLSLGPLALEQTWTLLPDADGDEAAGSRTRLALKIAAESAVAVVGGVLDRFEIRQLVTDRVGGSLDAIQGWCERLVR
jgi:uncharacterized protein YndB with AHSA1/START domain